MRISPLKKKKMIEVGDKIEFKNSTNGIEAAEVVNVSIHYNPNLSVSAIFEVETADEKEKQVYELDVVSVNGKPFDKAKSIEYAMNEAYEESKEDITEWNSSCRFFADTLVFRMLLNDEGREKLYSEVENIYKESPRRFGDDSGRLIVDIMSLPIVDELANETAKKIGIDLSKMHEKGILDYKITLALSLIKRVLETNKTENKEEND